MEKLKGVFEQTPFLPQCQPIFDLMGEGAEPELRAIAIGMALTALPDDDREIAAVILEHAGAHRFAEITREASTEKNGRETEVSRPRSLACFLNGPKR